MRINLQEIDRENFRSEEMTLLGERLTLVTPRTICSKWSKDTLRFRSSIWDENGGPVSLSFPKFFNWGESPHIAPPPSKLEGCSIVEKVDGSTLIVSRWRGHTFFRTRGTFDAEKLPNGSELVDLRAMYPFAFGFDGVETADYSLLFEWVTPQNRIVINYPLGLKLIGKIYHADYSLETQDRLDGLAKTLGVPRPRRYKFDSVDGLRAAATSLNGEEGFCVYYNHDQNILKLKSEWYLRFHALKAEFSSLEKVLDFYFVCGRPKFEEFFYKVAENLDFEIAEQNRGNISRICNAAKEVENIIAGMGLFAGGLVGLSRKEAALKIVAAYGDTNRASFIFQILDGKTLKDNSIKKLFWQVLKK